MDIIEDLKWRGALNQCTDLDGLTKLLSEKKVALYCGTDPTGDSLHIGHLIPFMLLKRFQLAGHHPYIIIGGGTGFIGDPSGRKTERQLLSTEQLDHNKKALTKQMTRLFGTKDFHIVDNYEWLSKIDLLTFLRDYGKLFSINTMLSREAVASRLKNGISFTEFSYQILQSIDFLHLYDEDDVQLQVGGADQWGNLVDGVNLIHDKHPEAKAFGLTIPLMVKADGTKFGKTAGGAIWLDPEKTTPFEFYQFWLNQDDRDVVKYLKYFTFLSHEEIDDLAEKVKTQPWKREAQRRLAEEVTKFVHGEDEMKKAERISQILFKGNIQDLATDEVELAFHGTPQISISSEPVDLVRLLTDNGVEPSRRQAREDIKNGAIHVNGEKITDIEATVDPADHFDGKFVVIRKGKKHFTLAKVNK